MYEDDVQPGRAPPEAADADMEFKKKSHPPPHTDAENHGFSEKRDSPPRFSTLFGTAPASASIHQSPPREYVREYYPEPERKPGVFMPMALFVLFAVILFFESTILFAYTVIGLYNNAPSRIFPWAGRGTATAVATTTACEHGPAVNIAPNFIIPGQQQTQQGEDSTVTSFITITPTVSSTTSSTSTTSGSSTSSSANTAAAIPDIVGILGGLASAAASKTSSAFQSIAIVTVAPEQSTATSIKLITEDASGNVVSGQPAPTVTHTTFVDPPAPTSSSKN